jgi:hypothetical protein
LIRVAGILTAAIRMMQPTCCGLTTSQRHPPRVLHPHGSDPATHRPPDHLTSIPVQQRRHLQPALSRPHIADSASPYLSRPRHAKLARAQVRRDRIALVTIRGDRTARLGTRHHHPRLTHQLSRLRSSHGEALILEWFGQAPTAITVTRVGRQRLDTGSQDDFLRIDLRACLSWQIRIKATAADLEPLTQDGNRPGVLGLGHTGLPQFDPLAQKPRAFFNMSRSMRHRVFSSRHRRHSSCSEAIRPFPENAARPCVSKSRFQRPNLWALIPRLRAVSETP